MKSGVHKMTSDFIYCQAGRVLRDQCLVLDKDGVIIDIVRNEDLDLGDVQRYHGWLLPGFVNTHCHLELSHMRQMLPTGTGLIPFIHGVISKRMADPDMIENAIQQADQEMYENGLVAVGDISNTRDSFATKANSQLLYHTFIEAFDLLQVENFQATVDSVLRVARQCPQSYTIVPHAPYSCTPELLQWIDQINSTTSVPISIHNQETRHENSFFQDKTGALVQFYQEFGIDINHFEAIGQNSIHYLLQYINPLQRTLLVHNTVSTKVDIHAAERKMKNLYWVTCARANLYIENRLPDYRLFVDNSCNMTIGTDSLASNWSLSVWDELCTIKKLNSWIANDQLLSWATINGAEALALSDRIGTIEVGKRPGILHLESDQILDQLISDRIRPRRVI